MVIPKWSLQYGHAVLPVRNVDAFPEGSSCTIVLDPELGTWVARPTINPRWFPLTCAPAFTAMDSNIQTTQLLLMFVSFPVIS